MEEPRALINVVTVLTVFAVVFPAELPDKSLFASLVLGTRFRPLYVWLGCAAAFVVHVVIAVSAGSLLTLLPQRLVDGLVAALFAIGAAVLLLGKEETEEEPAEGAAEADDRPAGPWRVVATSFGVVFLGEWGDITQITTANMAARYEDPLSVGLGAGLALCTVSALAVTLGRSVLRWVPVLLVRRIAGVLLAIFAVISLIELIRG